MILRDGSEVGVEVAYVGLTPHGWHEWQITSIIDLGEVVGLACAVMPARTTIAFWAKPP